MVLDADALNILSNNMGMLKACQVPIVMTPHMMEMSRLIGKDVSKIAKDRFMVAKKRKLGCRFTTSPLSRRTNPLSSSREFRNARY